jgi:HK97 family phage major capsid protein
VRSCRGLLSGQPLSRAAEERALSEGTLTAGGHLVPTPLATEVIDLVRNQMRTAQAGVRTVPMVSQTLKVPRLTGEGTPAWHAENALITSADMTFDAVTFTARTLTRLVVLSIELFEDSDPSAEGVIAQSFARQIALEVDRAVLRGSGTPPEPQGIRNQTGVTVTSHGANGSVIGSPPAAGTMGWEFLVDAAATVRGANFEPNAMILAPRTEQSLAKLRDTTNQYIQPPRYLEGLTRLQSKQVPINLTVGTSTDCSEVYTGQWDMAMVGIRTALRILPLRERFIDNGQYGFLAWLRADVQLAQPTAFNVDLGVRS